MIFLIGGSSHTGKTLLAQKLLEKYRYPCFSIDHLKMGLIRSGQTALSPEDDEALTDYLWPIVREMVKTAIENQQNLIIEGSYIPYGCKNDFSKDYLVHIKHIFLVFSPNYIKNNYETIISHENAIEKRLHSGYPIPLMLADNQKALEECKKHHCKYILIENEDIFHENIEESLWQN